MEPLSRRKVKPCMCKAYPFPHRSKGGKCGLGPRCVECGKLCEVKMMDVGEGSYEFWGQRGYDKNLVEVSVCCEAEVEG